MNPLHAEKRIHTRSTPNVDTARLCARLDWLRAHLPALARACEQKNDFRAHAREVVNIERELAHRQVPFVPVTDGLTDGRHLTVRPDVRLLYPPLSWKEREANRAARVG